MKSLSLLFYWALLGVAGALTGCSNTAATFGRSTANVSAAATAAVQITWAASSGSPSGYYVEQSSNGVNFTQVQSVATTTATVSGLTLGSTYYFRVRAYNPAGDSGYTATTVVSIPVPSPSPSPI
jgi:predicted phage tail protein